MIHAGHNSVPHQLIIRSPRGNNAPTNLLDKAEIEVKEGVRMMNLASAILHCQPSNSTDVPTALVLIRDAYKLLAPLLDDGHSTIAGRLVGTYRIKSIFVEFLF